MVQSGEILALFQRQNQEEFLTDWILPRREKSRVKDGSKFFDLGNWKNKVSVVEEVEYHFI